MSVALTKVDKFVLNLGSKAINLASDQLKVALTNTAPTVATCNQLSDLTSPIAATNLNGATPFNLTTTSYAQASGTAKLIIVDLVLTATGAVGPFRYIVIYSDTATNDEIIGFYDYGSSVTLATGDTFTIDFDGSAGVLTLA